MQSRARFLVLPIVMLTMFVPLITRSLGGIRELVVRWNGQLQVAAVAVAALLLIVTIVIGAVTWRRETRRVSL